MQIGFVALLDVLGFSSLISGDGEGEPLRTYMRCLQEALEVSGDGPSVDYVVFSDSIVLTTREDSKESVQALLLRTSHLFGVALENGIALRGAVAHGGQVPSFL